MLLVSSTESRELDAQMIDQVGIPSVALMEAAGIAVARQAVAIACAKSSKHRFGVVVGKGNNGADALVAARHLLAQGHQVVVWLSASAENLSELCRGQYEAYRRLGGLLAGSGDDLKDADVIIDGLLGTGSRLPLSDAIKTWTKAIVASRRPIVAIDIPTGVDADTGQADDDALQAVVTVACGFAKIGHFQYPGRALAGEVIVESLSMTDALASAAGVQCRAVTSDDASKLYKQRTENSHKGSFGRAVVFAGSEGMYGAARLAVEAAYRVGAGLVDYLAARDLPSSVKMAFPVETLMKSLRVDHRSWSQSGLADVAYHLQVQGVSVGLCGPGLGSRFVDMAAENPEWLDSLSSISTPLVIDADFLNALSQLPARGKVWLQGRQGPTILTPHPKEFARLTGLSVSDVQADRVRLARAYATEHGVTLVLKGAGSVIASYDGQIWINTTGNSGLATGGTGDVLSGMTAGLLATGYGVREAVQLAAYVHGRCADIACVAAQSEESLIASDLFSYIGQVFLELRRNKDGVISKRRW